jgi:hypothetical protein
MKMFVSIALVSVIAVTAWAATEPTVSPVTTAVPAAPEETQKAPKIRYKQSDDINFEKLLIEGQLQKPSVTVVTGTVKKGGDGLLRMRKNFLDRVARDYGEKSQ